MTKSYKEMSPEQRAKKHAYMVEYMRRRRANEHLKQREKVKAGERREFLKNNPEYVPRGYEARNKAKPASIKKMEEAYEAPKPVKRKFVLPKAPAPQQDAPKTSPDAVKTADMGAHMVVTPPSIAKLKTLPPGAVVDEEGDIHS